MAILIKKPVIVPAAGAKPKSIEEFIGRVTSGTTGVSIARMRSPEGWQEPGQEPEFDEYTIVLAGAVRVKLMNQQFDVTAGQAVLVGKGEGVQYSTPFPNGAEYLSVCVPAFSPETVHRDER